MRILLFRTWIRKTNTHTHTWKILSTINLNWIDTPTSSLSQNFHATDAKTHMWKFPWLTTKSTSTRIHDVKISPGIQNVFIAVWMVCVCIYLRVYSTCGHSHQTRKALGNDSSKCTWLSSAQASHGGSSNQLSSETAYVLTSFGQSVSNGVLGRLVLFGGRPDCSPNPGKLIGVLRSRPPSTEVALYRATRPRLWYGFKSCDANGPRNVKNANLAKHRPVFLPPLLLVGSNKLVLKVPKRGQFHAAIRVTIWRCDSCAQGALGRRTVSRRNFCDAESPAKRCGETCH